MLMLTVCCHTTEIKTKHSFCFCSVPTQNNKNVPEKMVLGEYSIPYIIFGTLKIYWTFRRMYFMNIFTITVQRDFHYICSVRHQQHCMATDAHHHHVESEMTIPLPEMFYLSFHRLVYSATPRNRNRNIFLVSMS